MSRTVLGLDLGPNSIGWALVDESDNKIIASGVRIFPEGVDNFDTGKEESRNEARRLARGMRRQTLRRARRKRVLRKALIQASLFPTDPDEQFALYQNEDPYDLRDQALSKKLTPHQIGRVLLHLNQRRGFKSNRKTDAKDKDNKGLLAEISELESQIKASGHKTLGQHLAKLRQEDPLKRIRTQHTRRDMYETEFDAIWEAQAHHHPDLLTDQLRYGATGKQSFPREPQPIDSQTDWLTAYGIHGILFFQRKMYWPKSMVGLCELEKGERRCPRADRAAQRFRLLTEVNNLDSTTNTERGLSDEERTLLLDKLGRTKDMTFDAIRKALGFLESVRFNLEKGKRPKLLGVPVDALMANKNVFGKQWYDRSEDEKNEIVRLLLDNDRDEDALLDRAVSEWGLTPQRAEALLAVDFPSGYLHLSLKAINKLLPHMERGLIYMADDAPENSALAAAGYLRRDQLQRRIYDKLPMPDRMNDAKLSDLPNPVVRRTLTELRKVVNAIIREYGKPDNVHVEMARSMKMGQKKRREYNKDTREREAARAAAENKIQQHGVKASRDAINRYLIWEQQSHLCAYTGKPISISQLFGGEIDMDHILPYSRSLDDSQMNKVVCFRHANAEKGNRTPHEWLAEADPKRYDVLCQRAKNLPYPKYRRFLQKELDTDKFITRQLVDTAYISKLTAEYLRCLFDNDHDVLGLKGQYTSEVRYQWGLHDILRDDGLDLKNRDDHRHHAVDAIVIALTNRSRLQQLRNIRKSGGVLKTGEAMSYPWDTFYDNVKDRVNTINVSHRVERKVRGALHKETLYGPTHSQDGNPIHGEYVVRKPIESLSASEIDSIRDKTIKALVIDRLKQHGIEFGRGKNNIPKEVWQQPLTMPTSGVLIKKVRIVKRDKTIQPIRQGKPGETYIKPGATHHICIFEFTDSKGKTKRDAVCTTMLEAVDRLKQQQQRLDRFKKNLKQNGASNSEIKRKSKQEMKRIAQEVPLITRKHPDIPDAKFIMSLSMNEMVLMQQQGKDILYRFEYASSTSQQMWFRHHAVAVKSNDNRGQVSKNPNTMQAKKITVDPLGRIRWAND